MPARRLLVRKIREVLRLKHEQGLSHRAIARACAVRRFKRRWLDRLDRRGPHPRRREPDAGPIASHRSGPARDGPRKSGFTGRYDTADTVREGHAAAGHDQSGNVGGRGSTVPRFENPNRPARQAVPPLRRQAQGVVHALYLETAGQPETAPRPLLRVPARRARRFADLPGSRRLNWRRPDPDEPPLCLPSHGQP